MMREKQKKICSILLSIVMVVSLFAGVGPLKVQAAETHGEHSADDGWVDLETKDASNASNQQYRIEESGKYYLSTNVTKQVYVGGTDTDNDIDVILCLNGHNISYDSQSTAAVVVYGSVNLTITDCSDNDTKSCITDTSGYGAGIEQRGNATVKLENVAVKSTGDSSNGIEIVPSLSSSSGNLELDNSTIEAKGAAINKSGNGYIKISNSTLGNSSYYLNDNSYCTIYTSDYNSEPIENITISNSTFYGGVEINSVCNNLTLTESDFHSGSTCFRLVGGNAVVTDCDFMRSSDLKSATGFCMGVKDSTLTISGGKFQDWLRVLGMNMIIIWRMQKKI